MLAIPVAQPEPFAPAPTRPPVLHQVVAPDAAAVASTESNRWLRFLAVPFVLSAASFMALLATGQLWLVGAMLVTGPGLLIMSFVYLSMSSDSNADR